MDRRRKATGKWGLGKKTAEKKNERRRSDKGKRNEEEQEIPEFELHASASEYLCQIKPEVDLFDFLLAVWEFSRFFPFQLVRIRAAGEITESH